MIAYVLNLIDLAFTLHALGRGAVELNPLMQSVTVLLWWKVGVAGLLCCLLEILAIKYQVAKWGLRICTAVFAVINLWHIINLALAWAA
jgi:hypothetical protein